MISFKPFFLNISLEDISTYSLIKKHNISSSTINRLRHDKPVSTETINKLCEILKCDISDVAEYIADKGKS